VTAGLVVVPQAMAYATIADLPVEVGLYTCMVPMAVYALLGGSRTLSVSTTSTIATLTASTLVAAGVAAGSEDALGDLATLTILAGAVLLGARLFHLGPLVDNISDAVVTGLKVGVGLTVAAGQLPRLLGIPAEAGADDFFSEMWSALRRLDDANAATVALSVGTIAVILGLGRVAPRVPAPLVAVAGGIGLVVLASIDDRGVALIAEIPRGLPAARMPAFDRVGELVPGAVAIALMAYLETVSVARSVRRPDEPSVDNDQELVANGAASVAGAFFGSLPPAGGFSQTAINQQAGARTQLSGLTTVALAVGAALFLGPVLDDLPDATLGAIVVVAVIGLVRPSELVFLARIDRLELFVALLTAGVGLSVGLLAAVAVGVATNLLLVLRELNHAPLTELRAGPDGVPVPAEPGLDPVPGLLVLRVGAPLYTANVRQVQREIVAAVERADPRPEVVVVDATVVGLLSATVLGVVRETADQLDREGVTLWVASLPPRALTAARQAPGWHRWEDEGRVQPSTQAAVQAFLRTRDSA
jgi:SulP family sulfate permease